MTTKAGLFAVIRCECGRERESDAIKLIDCGGRVRASLAALVDVELTDGWRWKGTEPQCRNCAEWERGEKAGER